MSATVSFVEPNAAAQSVDYAVTHGVTIMDRPIKVRWSNIRPHTLSPDAMHAPRRGATREVFVSNAVKVGGMRSGKLLQDF